MVACEGGVDMRSDTSGIRVGASGGATQYALL